MSKGSITAYALVAVVFACIFAYGARMNSNIDDKSNSTIGSPASKSSSATVIGQEPKYTKEEISAVCGAVDKMVETGFIRKYSPDYVSVYVDPVLWSGINIDEKEMIFKSVGACQDAHENFVGIQIFSYQSGKKIAVFYRDGLRIL